MTREPLLKLDKLIDRLRKEPGDQKALGDLLDLLVEGRVAYYSVGEYYEVPERVRGRIQKRILRLKRIAGPCSRECVRKLVCPGKLIFEDGTEACPHPSFRTNWIVRADPTHDAAVTRAVLKILHRGHKSGSVELLDGSTIEFQVKKPPEGVSASPSPDPE